MHEVSLSRVAAPPSSFHRDGVHEDGCCGDRVLDRATINPNPHRFRAGDSRDPRAFDHPSVSKPQIS